MVRCIEEIDVREVEKRRYPSKYYTYIADVLWDDGNVETIARRYSEFFDLHLLLMDKFPTEGGAKNPSHRIIPFLPGKVFFLSEAKAKKRIPMIDEYCKCLIRLPIHISQCDSIRAFFEQSADDQLPANLNKDRSVLSETVTSMQEITGPVQLDQYIVIADFQKESNKELSLKSGEIVELLEKTDTGWWMVMKENKDRGWAPSVYLEDLSENQSPSKSPKRVAKGNGTWYVTTTSFEPESDFELGFKSEEKLEILEQSLDGWWFASTKEGGQGWVPGASLQKFNPDKTHESNIMRGIYKRPAPKRSSVRSTVKTDDRIRAKEKIRQKLIKQQSGEKDDDDLPEYVTICEFQNTFDGGISYKADQTVHILQKSSSGWWYCKIGFDQGWISENHLKPKETDDSADNMYCATRPLSQILSPRPAVNNNKSPNFQSVLNKAQQFQFPVKSMADTKSSNNKPPRPTTSPKTQRPAPKSPTPNIAQSPNKSKPSLAKTNKFQQKLDTFEESDDIYGDDEINVNSQKTDLTKYRWYKNIQRGDAEAMIKRDTREGCFIIRRSKDFNSNQPYSITLFHNQKIWNFHIRRRSDQRWAVGAAQDGEAAFANVPELVQYYSTKHLLIGDRSNGVLLLHTP